MIRFDNVTFAYRADLPPAVVALNLSFAEGQRVAIVGANGSGKSTLARLANGLLLPGAGRVTVGDVDTRDADGILGVRQAVGLVFQNPDEQIVATTVEADVAFGPENLGLEKAEIRHRVDEALYAVGLVGLERREPHMLSGGQKQRLAIAGALAMRPRILVFDEPTSMLDPTGRDEVLGVMTRLAEDGHGIVHITHDLAEAALCDQVVVVHRGAAVFEGAPEDLLACDDLGAWGLELPALVSLGRSLGDLGVEIPLARLTAARLAAAL